MTRPQLPPLSDAGTAADWRRGCAGCAAMLAAAAVLWLVIFAAVWAAVAVAL